MPLLVSCGTRSSVRVFLVRFRVLRDGGCSRGSIGRWIQTLYSKTSSASVPNGRVVGGTPVWGTPAVLFLGELGVGTEFGIGDSGAALRRAN